MVFPFVRHSFYGMAELGTLAFGRIDHYSGVGSAVKWGSTICMCACIL